MKTVIFTILMAGNAAAFAFELATKVYQEGTATILQTSGYAHIPLLRRQVSLTGIIEATGTVTVKGAANIVMWSKVGGVYYFTKLPGLQNVSDVENLNINIPFNAAEKTITEVVIEVEMLSGGGVSIRDLSVKGSE